MIKRLFILLCLLPTLVFAEETYVNGQTNSGHFIQDEGTTVRQRDFLNFTGGGVSVSNVGRASTVNILGASDYISDDAYGATWDSITTIAPSKNAIYDAGFELSSNKVTSISGSSTDVQYPSAKLLYDQLALKLSTITADPPLSGSGTSGSPLIWSSTAIESKTWGAGSLASFAWTFDVSGTDDIVTFGNGIVTFNGDVAIQGDLYVYDVFINAVDGWIEITNTQDNASVMTALFQGDRATPADNDEQYQKYQMSNDLGTEVEIARVTEKATDINNATSVDGQIEWDVVTAGSLLNKMTLSGSALTLATGMNLIIGTTQWNSGDSIDGTKVANADLGEIGVSSGVWSVENAAVIGKVLTGYSSGAGTVAATDTILQAINKLNGNTAAKADAGQQFYIGTTQVAINRGSGALTLAGITLTTPNIGAATATANIAGLPHQLRFTIIDPATVYGKDTQVCLWAKTDAAITITNLELTCNADPTTELTGDIKYADTFLGLANSAVINDFDTTNGARSDSSIASGAVAAGKAIYLQWDTTPDSAITQISGCLTYDYD